MKTDMKVLAYQIHGYRLIRKAIITRPDGKVDDYTFRNDNFDYTHQDMISLNPPYILKKGSTVKTICDYDTTSKQTLTFGGIGTDDEMCIIGINYYPSENNREKFKDIYKNNNPFFRGIVKELYKA